MAQSGDQPSNLPAAALVVTVLAAGGFLAFQEPLDSLRPKERIDNLAAEVVDENVEARLWQDPLQVVHANWSSLVQHVSNTDRLPPAVALPQTIAGFRRQLEEGAPTANRLHIIVTMPSSPYADDAEHRRRQRYALVTALSASGYNAEYPDRIGYFIAPSTRAAPPFGPEAEQACAVPGSSRWLCPMPEAPLIVGYETFTPDPNGSGVAWDEVLVLWTARRNLGRDHLLKLIALKKFIEPASANYVAAVLLGPDDSGGLKDMLDSRRGHCGSSFDAAEYGEKALAFGGDARRQLLDVSFRNRRNPGQIPAPGAAGGGPASAGETAPDGEDCDNAGMPAAANEELLDIHILSPRSTVPLELLFPGEGFDGLSPADGDARIAALLGVRNFFSVLSRDDVVIANIVEELRSRGMDNCRAASGIAVISEIDSSYGRALPTVVQQSIEDRMGCKTPVHAFGYLRGVDGELPPGSDFTASSSIAERAAANAENVAVDLTFAAGTPDSAVGVAQTDYIRRLAEHIARRHVALTEHNHEGFRAIGVLGADVYDKQLILHALRERLPAVTFFTTDLDARLNAPREFRWSRNLLIGSSFGLAPPEAELEVPPLRDSYQTAFFLATRFALRINESSWSPDFRSMVKPPPPRLFEIGRSGAIDITVCKGECVERSELFGEIGWTRYSGGIGDQLARTLILLSPLLVLALVCFAMLQTLADKRCEDRVRAKSRSLLLSGSAIAIIATILWSWNSSDLEPWLLTEGVSSLPTLVLHLTAIVYSICFVLIVHGRIRQSNLDCERRFGLEFDENSIPASDAWQPLQKGWMRKVWLRGWVKDVDEARGVDSAERDCTAQRIWSRYRLLGMAGPRALRIAPPALITSAIVVLVLNLEANPLLARDMQGLLDFVRSLTVVAVTAVIFVCVDTLRLGRLLIRALVAYDLSDWCGKQEPADGLDQRVSRLWRKMDLIVTHSELLTPLLVLPFILLSLLILARLTLFEGWIWTPSLIAVYLGFSVYLLVRALLYQREAAKARDTIVDELLRLRIDHAEDETMVRRIGYVLDEISSINHGAFVPWTRHPIVQSVLLPTSGVGALSLFGMLT